MQFPVPQNSPAILSIRANFFSQLNSFQRPNSAHILCKNAQLLARHSRAASLNQNAHLLLENAPAASTQWDRTIFRHLRRKLKRSRRIVGGLKAYTLFSCYSGCSGAAVVEGFRLSCAQALQSNSCSTAARLSYMASGCGGSGRHARGAPKPNLGVSWRCFAPLKCTISPLAIRIATIATHVASKLHM